MKPGLALLFAIAASGQSAGPRLDVASVKPHVAQPGLSSWSVGPARIHISGKRVWVDDADVSSLILGAYAAQSDQLSADKISDRSRYDVEMEASESVDEEQARALLQALLTDRFLLKIGRSTKTRPVYRLVVGKNGSKLKRSAVGTKPAIATVPSAEVIRSRFSNQSTSDLAGFLRLMTPDRRPVLDETG